MQLYQLDKTVLSIKNNPAQFLNGLTSNTLEKPQNAFLSIHGRVIAVFEQAKIDDNEFWIVVATPMIEALLAHVDRYVKLSNIQVTPLQKHVYFDLDNNTDSPRDVDLVISLNKGRFFISEKELPAGVSDETFTLFRLKNNIPLQGVDFTDEFVLNVGAKDFVSFTKGCFLGQEPVSKVHNRSKPTWQLAVQYEDECDEEARTKMTSKVLDPGVNRVLGFTFIRNQ